MLRIVPTWFRRALSLSFFASILAIVIFAQQTTQSGSDYDSAPGSGKRIIVKPESLPLPLATKSALNFGKVVPQPADAKLQLPPGFKVEVFAEGGGFKTPRWVIEAANGDLIVSDAASNNLVLLRDVNKDHKIDNQTERFVFAEGLNLPFGMAIHNGFFYAANTNSVVRWKYQPGTTKLEGAPEKIIDLPGEGYRQHWTRNLSFSPDGKKLYVSVGSETNANVEADARRAAISEYNPDGSGHRIFASGLRNPIGLAWNPVTKQLWTAVNERDGLGDDLVPDYATSVKEDGFYGWPYVYLGNNVDPRREADLKSIRLKGSTIPDVLFEAHCAALGIVFYTGKMFPKEYQGDAFVALHGSWNRARRSGYKVVRIPFEKGKPEGGYENFMTGFVTDTPKQDVWGRPVGLLQRNDGSLLVVDDGGTKIWRITYAKK